MSLIEHARCYVKERIAPDFHEKRLASLTTLKLSAVLKRKNPYLFRAKAIHICSHAYDGKKSTTEGIDLEFSCDGTRYIVLVKSGPNWGNASQIAKRCSRLSREGGNLLYHCTSRFSSANAPTISADIPWLNSCSSSASSAADSVPSANDTAAAQ